MVSSVKTTFVWSLSVLVFTIGVTSNDLNDLSTNHPSTEGSSVQETTQLNDAIAGKLPELISNACPLSGQCQNGGSCVSEDGGNYCQCKNGTSGMHCEIVDECEKKPSKCGIGSDVQCTYNISKEAAECKCSNASQSFDSSKKKCRAPCKTSEDCPEYINCRKNRDNDLRFCKCSFGWAGDKCNEKVDECKAIGYDCGTNPNVTCEENTKGDAVCYCPRWSDGFNYEVKDCVKCNCEGSNLGCFFQPGGAKTCYCQDDYYQKDEKCVECNCGYGSRGCKSENGAKVCDCWGIFLQNGDKCEDCDCGKNSNGCSFQNGQKTCSCKSGYIQSNGTCKKICNEWSIYDVCKNGGKCNNRACECLNGTQGDRCEIIDGCEHSWDVSFKCGYSSGVECAFNQTSLTSYCGCKQKDLFFDSYDQRCKECDCGSHGNCSFIGGEKTCQCEEGYAENPGTGWYGKSQCSPCDCGFHTKECKFPYHDSKVCTCGYDYVLLNDECTECDCGPYGECSFNIDGEKVCDCDQGYSDRDGFCTLCSCGDHGECVWNKFGEVTCNCREGFGVKDGKCEQCSCYWANRYEGTSRYINCTFRYGVQKCSCPKGYEEKRKTYCSDIDECEDPSRCPMTTECENVPGSYKCNCRKGYRPYNEAHDTRQYDCIDINECLEQNECPFRDTSECKNTQGSYYCECKPGYVSKYSSKYSNSYSIEIEGCKKDQTGWKVGYIILIVAFGIVSVGLIIAICKRRSSS